MSNKNRRRRLFAQWDIQGNLCVRVIFYWLICQAVTLGTAFFLAQIIGSDGAVVGRYLMPAFVVSTLILPMVLLDVLFFSNKFAGPILVLRRSMKRLANEGKANEMKLRPGDYLDDVSESFNKICGQFEHRVDDSDPSLEFETMTVRSK